MCLMIETGVFNRVQFHVLALNAPLNIHIASQKSRAKFFTFTILWRLIWNGAEFAFKTAIYFAHSHLFIIVIICYFTIYIEGLNGVLSLPRQRQIIIILFASVEVAQVQVTFISLSHSLSHSCTLALERWKKSRT